MDPGNEKLMKTVQKFEIELLQNNPHLGVGVTIVGPSVNLPLLAKHSVLLLESKQGFLSQDLRAENVCHEATGVGGMGSSVRVQDFTEDKDIVSTTDWVRYRVDWAKNAVRVVSFCLSSAVREK